jgi:hypothetical protein
MVENRAAAARATPIRSVQGELSELGAIYNELTVSEPVAPLKCQLERRRNTPALPLSRGITASLRRATGSSCGV